MGCELSGARSDPAIDGQDGTGDETGSGRQQKVDGRSHLGGLTPALQRDRTSQTLVAFG
jgi:hypothetical protein